jgi:putative membrane protein
MSLGSKKVLVLSVDKDDDIGRATGVATPLIGREKVLSVASLFAIKSPEDSDTNSMFASINTYDSLLDQGFNCEVAAIAGTASGGFEADLKLSSELEYVLNNFKAEGVIFISDGAADEQVIPTIQAKIPVISVRRVFVQQQKSIEETYVLFSRYLRKLADPQYSKVALGVPGLIILAAIALYFLNLISYVLISMGIIIGAVLLIKGFHLDSLLMSQWEESPIMLITTIISFIICAVSIYRGAGIAQAEAPLPHQAALFFSIFIVNTIDLFIVGIGVYIAGLLVVKYIQKSPKIWRQIVALVAIVFIREMFVEIAPIIVNPQSSLVPFLFTAGIGVVVCALLVIMFTVTPRITKGRAKPTVPESPDLTEGTGPS